MATVRASIKRQMCNEYCNTRVFLQELLKEIRTCRFQIKFQLWIDFNVGLSVFLFILKRLMSIDSQSIDMRSYDRWLLQVFLLYRDQF